MDSVTAGAPGSDEVAAPAQFASLVARRLERMEHDGMVARLWSGDASLWPGDPALIANRLGWLYVPRWAATRVPLLESFAREVFDEGFRSVLLLGIGGATLGAEAISGCVTPGPRRLDLRILDSTHPAEVAAATAELDLARTLVIVASKSGRTIETRCLLDYFAAHCDVARQFVAITNEGSDLAALAARRGFRQVFLDPPGVGGRFSALSYFGLVPAALLDTDLDAIVSSAAIMAQLCGPGTPLAANPGAFLGTVLGASWLAGRGAARIRIAEGLAPMGAWVEQMIAESTGKAGRGILPIVRDTRGLPGQDDRSVDVLVGGAAAHDRTVAPSARLTPAGIGGEIFRWEFATAVAGFWLAINPFDEPDVQDSKDRTDGLLAGGSSRALPGTLDATLASVRPSDYLAINAFLPRDAGTCARLEGMRNRLEARCGVPVLVAHGPRFLHSTGQLQKGGPASVVAIQVVDDATADLAIPGRPYGFATLTSARADADLAALVGRGRRVARTTLDDLDDALRALPRDRAIPASMA